MTGSRYSISTTNKRRWFGWWLWLAPALVSTAGAVVPAMAEPGWEVGTTLDTLRVETADVCLSHRFVDASRLAVVVGPEALLAGRDFDLDPVTGCLHLRYFRRFEGKPLVARYAYFPFALESIYARRQLVNGGALAAPADSVVTLPRQAASSSAPGAQLHIRGYKTFAVKLGSGREPSLNQALDLDVSGEVAKGVQLRALLSDRDLPLAAEGNTETLDEIDQVMLEVRTRRLAATLGDYDIRTYTGEFLSYAKRLEGVKAEGKTDERGFVLAAAVSKGEFTSLELSGVDGKQGPYLLTGPDGSGAISVIAGSETVWLDGQRLARGENRDYTIDYSRAELTLTPSRLVTADSRITVDFELATQSYERNFYVGGGRSRFLDGALELTASMVSEADDFGNPLSQLSEAEKRQLATAGDSARATSEAAGVFVGAGQGDYWAVPLGADRVRYQYAGSGRGDYEVRFAEVGEGAGDYADSTTAGGTIVFRYVGTAAGRFQPVRTLSAPAAHRLGDVAADWRVGERLSLHGEVALSGLDLNTASGLDDFDNGGRASHLSAALTPWGVADGAGLTVHAVHRQVGARFESLGRIRGADYGYGWNAPAAAFSGGELRREAGASWRTGHGLDIGAQLQSTDTPGFTGDRRAWTVTLARRLGARFRLERVDGRTRGAAPARRRRALEVAEVSTALGPAEPKVRFEREERRTDPLAGGPRSGTVFERLEAASPIALGRGVTLELGVAARIDRDLGPGRPWTDSRRAFENQVRLALPRLGATSVTATVTRRTTETVATGAVQTSALAQLDLAGSYWAGMLDTEAGLDITQTDVAQRGLELVFVGTGQGVYDAFGNFVGESGSYDLRRLDAVGADLRTRARLTARAELRPRRRLGRAPAGNWRRFWAQLGLETALLLDEHSSLNLANPRLLFDPASYQRTETFEGLWRFRQDLDVAEGNPWCAARLRYEREDEADNRTLGLEDDQGSERVGLRLRSSPSGPWSIEASGRFGNRFTAERAVSGAVAARLDLRQSEWELRAVYRPRPALRLGTTWLRRHDRARRLAAVSSTVEWSPSVTVTRGRFRTDLRWRVANEVRDGAFPPSYAAGLAPGRRTEYDLDVDYRATDRVTLTASLDGRGHPTRPFDHAARFEVRAAF